MCRIILKILFRKFWQYTFNPEDLSQNNDFKDLLLPFTTSLPLFFNKMWFLTYHHVVTQSPVFPHLPDILMCYLNGLNGVENNKE